MKVLYLPIMPHSILHNPTMVSDYQADCIFHGLKKLLGYDLDEFGIYWWMYKEFADENPEVMKKIWGKGFSVYGLIEDISVVDPSVITKKLRSNRYDFIVSPIHHTLCNNNQAVLNHIQTIKNHGVKKEQLLVVDGWDRPDIHRNIMDECTYFKREHDGTHDAHPISFAIPEEKVTFKIYNKERAFSEMIPAMHSWGHTKHLETYKYNSEEEYYQQYRESYFGYTCKKAGWDCMRHYEIMANNCIPWFTDIEKCPPTIMTNFPKDLCVEAKKMMGVQPGTVNEYDPNEDTYLGDTRQIKPVPNHGEVTASFDKIKWAHLQFRFTEHLRKHLTTKKLAEYILSR